MPFVTTVAEARRAVALGADAVVAQGAEAGGLRGTFQLGPDGEVPLIRTMALVPLVVDAVKVPVVAAGGVMDGRGLLAALALGADGIMLRDTVQRGAGGSTTASWRARCGRPTETEVVVNTVANGRPAQSAQPAGQGIPTGRSGALPSRISTWWRPRSTSRRGSKTALSSPTWRPVEVSAWRKTTSRPPRSSPSWSPGQRRVSPGLPASQRRSRQRSRIVDPVPSRRETAVFRAAPKE